MISKKIVLTAYPSDVTLSRGCDLVFVNVNQAFIKYISKRYLSYDKLKGEYDDLNTIFFKDTACKFFAWDKKIGMTKTKDGEPLKSSLQGGLIEMKSAFRLPEKLVAVITESVMALSSKGIYFIATVDNEELVYSRMIPREMFEKWSGQDETDKT